MLAWLKDHALGATALALAVGLGVQTMRLAGEQRDQAETRRAHAEQIAKLDQIARQAEADARTEERRRAAALQEIVDETRADLNAARADAAAAADAGERLRQRIATLTTSCRGTPGNPAVAGGGSAADVLAGVLADVQRRLDAAADGIARHADAAAAAGRACERAYDALTD